MEIELANYAQSPAASRMPLFCTNPRVSSKVIISFMVTSLFVFTRIISNPLSNIFQKKLTGNSARPVFIILVTYILLSLAMLPILFQLLPVQLGSSFFMNMFLAIVGNTLIVTALRLTDLSILGPINAYKSVVSLLLGIFILGEIPTLMGVAGIFLILVGSFFFIDRGSTQKDKRAIVQILKDRGVQFRLAALLFYILVHPGRTYRHDHWRLPVEGWNKK